jgi:hypothetical protein
MTKSQMVCASSLVAIAAVGGGTACPHGERPSSVENGRALSSTSELILPTDGLATTERKAATSLKELHNVIARDFSIVALHRTAKSVLSSYWGDLESTSISIEFCFAGEKNRNAIGMIKISTPHHWARFDYGAGGELKIASLTLTENGGGGRIILGMGFFPDGRLQSLAYSNGQGELIKRIAEWDEDGLQTQAESLDVPRKVDLNWRGPPTK